MRLRLTTVGLLALVGAFVVCSSPSRPHAAATGLSTAQARTAAPGAVSLAGVSASEGSSLSFARADHTHSTTSPVCTGNQVLTSSGAGLSCTTPATGLSSVTATAPLLGLGTAGSPLHWDFTAGNTWSGLQTFSGGAAMAASSITSGTFADSLLASAYSGTGACSANTWASTLTRNAAPTCTQPAFTNLSGTASTAQIPSLDASKITTGQLAIANGGTGAATVANSLVFIGPASGGPLAPSFRALAAGDVPALDATKITTGTLTRPVSLNSGETTFNTDALLFSTSTAGLDFNGTHTGLNLHSLSTAIHIDSSATGVIFDDLAAFTGVLGVSAGTLTTTSVPTTSDQTFTSWAPAGLTAPTIFAQRVYLNASTLTTASNYATVVAGSGAGNYVLKLCTSSVCVSGNTYLICTISCAAAASTVTSCTVNKPVTASLTLDWVVATACATTNPAGNATAYTTTP